MAKAHGSQTGYLVGLVPGKDLRPLLVAAVTLKGLVVLPRGFNSVNQVHQQLPLPLFVLGRLEAPALATLEHT